MLLSWLFSRTVREASYLCHRVRKVVNAQRDLLVPQALDSMAKAVTNVRATLAHSADRAAILRETKNLETVANKWLKPYPFAGARENVDVMLVALVVALGIRTFFLQPMAIPTGSMQPTLYGITHEDFLEHESQRRLALRRELRGKAGTEIPGVARRLFDRFVHGVKYYHLTAQEDGVVDEIEPPQRILPFVTRQLIIVGKRPYPVWFPPEKLEEKAGLHHGDSFRKGDDIIKLKVISGDRLFVDRFTYNFRRPRRGEIVIFATQGLHIFSPQGLPMLTPDTHYIKRLVALGSERVRIGDDQHLYINGQRLEASTPGFENVYSFEDEPKESCYSGHLNDATAAHYGKRGLAPNFPNETKEFPVPLKHYLFMGDNTFNSSDSRTFGEIPQEKVVGKCAFVFWPISRRFGWGFR